MDHNPVPPHRHTALARQLPFSGRGMNPNTMLMIVCSMVLQSVFFGVGAVIVLSTPALSEQAKFLLPLVIVTALLLAPVFSWSVARRMRLRHWGRRRWKEGDRISG